MLKRTQQQYKVARVQIPSSHIITHERVTHPLENVKRSVIVRLIPSSDLCDLFHSGRKLQNST